MIPTIPATEAIVVGQLIIISSALLITIFLVRYDTYKQIKRRQKEEEQRRIDIIKLMIKGDNK